jgi:tight adherence protein C
VSQLALIVGLLCYVLAVVAVILVAKPKSDRVSLGVEQIGAYYVLGDRGAEEPAKEPELAPIMVRLRRFTLRLLPSNATVKMQHKLDVAGNPARWDLDRILAAKTVALIALAGIGYLFRAGHGASGILTALAGAVAGFFLPDLLVYNVGLKRQEMIQKALPDAMDMMTVCVEAGLGFDSSLAQVARNTTGPLASEFARVLQEMHFGKSRTAALQALGERTTVPELRILVSALVQASELGIPVAAVMREQAGEMRLRRRQRAEEKAQKVTVKILFPLIFCLLPALFIVVMGPGVISIMHSFSGM